MYELTDWERPEERRGQDNNGETTSYHHPESSRLHQQHRREHDQQQWHHRHASPRHECECGDCVPELPAPTTIVTPARLPVEYV